MHKNITGTQETEIRAKIVERILEVIADLDEKISVFNRRRLIQNRADFAAKLGQRVTAGAALEMRFLEVSLERPVDLAEGSGKCPAVALNYNLHLFIEFHDGRQNGSNSDFETWRFIFALRDEFLRNENLPGITDAKKCEIEPMTFPERLNFGNDTLTDGTGHFVDLKLTVNFYS